MTTTNKPTLVFEQYLTLTSNWLQEIVAPYITLELYDQKKFYPKQSTVFYAPLPGPFPTKPTVVQQNFIDNGYRIVYDNLSEAMVNYPTKYVIQTPNWFRYNESLQGIYHKLNTYRPNRNYQHLALMPMRLQRPYRDLAVQKLQPWLDDFIWSYVAQGRQLPNDGDMNNWATQCHFNPEWYDNTCFSVVSESIVSNRIMFITEKTYKPIAFYHPFMILGPMGILKALKDQGFETFENLFDESYDIETSWVKRLDCLVDNVTHFVKQPYDDLTQQKIAHNHAHFFNAQLVAKQIVEEIIYPLLNYAET
jgi:hypothetical protein